MQVAVDERAGVFEIWLTGEDQRDEACLAQTKALIHRWSVRGYLPVVYKSGTQDLYESTAALLVSHRNRTAQRAAAQKYGQKGAKSVPF